MKKTKYDYSNTVLGLFEAYHKITKARLEIGKLLNEIKEHEPPEIFNKVIHKFTLTKSGAAELINAHRFEEGEKNG